MAKSKTTHNNPFNITLRAVTPVSPSPIKKGLLRKFTVIALLLLVEGCSRSGYTRADLIRNCLSEVNFDMNWVQMSSLPDNAIELRRIAFKNLRGLDPTDSPPREIWFRRNNTGYLICYLGARTGCGQTTASVLKTSSGWERGPGAITVC